MTSAGIIMDTAKSPSGDLGAKVCKEEKFFNIANSPKSPPVGGHFDLCEKPFLNGTFERSG